MCVIAAPRIRIAEGYRLMGIARSTYHEVPNSLMDNTPIVEAMTAICDEFEHYRWRRV